MIAYGILFLFFFQLISEFVEAIYAFGLLGTSIPPEIASLLFLFAPLLLVILPKPLHGRGLAVLAVVALLAGVAGVFLDTRLRMFSSGLGTACLLIYLPAHLWELAQGEYDQEDKAKGGLKAGITLAGGLMVGLAVYILLRAWNSGLYPFAETWFRFIVILLAVVGVWQVILGVRAGEQMESRLSEGEAADAEAPPVARRDPEPSRAGFLTILVLSFGLFAALALLYFAFGSPGVLTRWSGTNYIIVLGMAVTALSALAAWMAGTPGRARYAHPLVVGVWNLLFVVSMLVAILLHQVRFPTTPGAYPISEPLPGPLASVVTLLMVALFPVVLVNFVLLVSELTSRRASQRILGGAFGLGALFFLVMIFAHVFTTVYDYIPVVGPFFRNRFWLVYLVLGLAGALPLLAVRQVWNKTWLPLPRPLAGSVIGLGLAALIGAGLVSASPDTPIGERAGLVVMTYNIRQGYTQSGSRDPQAQLRVIQAAEADLIGLQESDSTRLAGGNNDLVRYFADRLDMYSYYGPKTVTGTFGIALLSRYPIENARTFYMYSEGEQAAAIHAQIRVGEQLFNVFVTHLGNGGPMIQQQNFLQEVGELDNVIAMGDFNFRPDSEQYALTREFLDDAWLLRWPSGADATGYQPDRRIDHVFLSPGLQVRSARFHTGLESDHPALIVEVSW